MKKNRENIAPDLLIKSSWHSIQRMYALIAKKHGISQAMGYTLISIERDGSTATDISKVIGVKAISLTRILNKLEGLNLISRHADLQDRRKVIFCLTEEGLKARKYTADIITDFNNLLLTNFTHDEIVILESISLKINKVTEEFSRMNPN